MMCKSRESSSAAHGWIASHVSGLSETSRQRHALRMLALLFQFVLELLRSWLTEEASFHIHRIVRRIWHVCRPVPTQSFQMLVRSLHYRNRDRLLHKLVTALQDEP